MLFNTPIFLCVFLPVSLAGFWLAGRWGRRPALVWLAVCSLFFYGAFRPQLVFLLVGSICVNFAIGQRLRGGSRRIWLVCGLAFNLGLLGFFKYANFFIATLGIGGASIGGVWLPLGISFFTFQQIMFLVDTAAGEASPPFLDYVCFVAFFPHVIAGPIVRPSDILPQLARLQPALLWRARLAAGFEIFLLGLAKKAVLADGLARFADPGFAAAARLDRITFIEAWVALLAYALQIYFDFSGYSDMAIGLARMFGINFPVNFNSPYKAVSISDFWQRWNMTLSRFLRNYLYIPLGGNRRGEVRRTVNLMVTMLLGGLWHGAAIRFIVWGGLHGGYLVIHGWWKKRGVPLPRFLSWGITLLAVLLAWVPFRAESFPAAMDFYRGLFGLNGVDIPDIAVRFWPGLAAFGTVVPVLPYLGDARTLSLPQALLFLLIAWSLTLLLPNLREMSVRRRSIALMASFALAMQAVFFTPAAIPFIYFQF
jgi:D-alanyl-lipoteichoic acid acyltransferase DltB (MBOAT superfamily)